MRRTDRHIVWLFGIELLAASIPGRVFGQWIESPGKGWLQLSLYHHDTRNRFDPRGKVEPLFNDGGRSIATSLFVTGVLGVIPGVDIWVQMPVHRLVFNDVAATRESIGPGDPLLHVRLGPELFGIKSEITAAVRGGVKLPLGEFPVDSEIVPLTEGQRDWELILEIGRSFYPAPMYAMAWLGYRWRESNFETDRKPGDERFAFFAIGGSRGIFNWKFSAEGIFGRKWVSLTGVRIPLAMSERRLVHLTPAVGWAVGGGVFEVGGRLPVAGRNFPAGPALFIGYFFRYGRISG